jgi:hypothetical protein
VPRLETSASAAELEALLALTERYCVVLQTLRQQPSVTASLITPGGS